MRKLFIRIGALLAFLSVGLGAFGAHGLESLLSAEQLATFKTGVQYQFYHTFALLILGVLMYRRQTTLMQYSAYAFIGGIILFSGSLYGLSIGSAMNFPVKWLGPVTPFGGFLFLLGWILLFVSTYQENELYRRPAKEDR